MFVTKPFNNWKHAIEVFNDHSQKDFHKTNVLRSENFIAVHTKNHKDIAQKLDSARAQQINTNRKRLIPIIQTIIFCSRQEIALLGLNDSSPLSAGPMHFGPRWRFLQGPI